jgi:hypothetical protein
MAARLAGSQRERMVGADLENPIVSAGDMLFGIGVRILCGSLTCKPNSPILMARKVVLNQSACRVRDGSFEPRSGRRRHTFHVPEAKAEFEREKFWGRATSGVIFLLWTLLLFLPGCQSMTTPMTVSQTAPIPTPPPTAPPATLIIYGAGMQAFADGLENLRIPVDFPYQGNRFRAETTGSLQSVRLWMKAGSGYSGGNGGTIKLSVEPDDGSSGHFPSGTVLASTQAAVGNTSTVGFLFTFNSPASVVAGTLYHVVISNVDASPNTNYLSTNNMANNDDTRQPWYSLTDWGAESSGNGSSWSNKTDTCPIMAVTINGEQQGMGYVDSPSGSQLTTLSGSTEVGEVFTVSGSSKTVTAVSFHLSKAGSPPAPLTVTLQSGSTTVFTGTIPASAFSSTAEKWGTVTFPSALTLDVGTSYHLFVSCSSCTSGNAYQVHPILKGNTDGYSVASTFPDGNYERNGSADSDYDAQFYFATT